MCVRHHGRWVGGTKSDEMLLGVFVEGTKNGKINFGMFFAAEQQVYKHEKKKRCTLLQCVYTSFFCIFTHSLVHYPLDANS